MTFPAWRRPWNWTGLHQADILLLSFLLLVHYGIQICPCAMSVWRAHPKSWIPLVVLKNPGPWDLVLENSCWESVGYSNCLRASGPACSAVPADPSGLGPFDMSPWNHRHHQAYLAVAYCQVPCLLPDHHQADRHQKHLRAYHRGRHPYSLKSGRVRPGRLIPCVLGIGVQRPCSRASHKPYD